MRLLLKIIAITVVGAALLAIGGFFIVPPAAKSALAESSRAAFGVPSSISGVRASPGLDTTSIGFSGFRLEAPAGFAEPVLTIGSFDLGVGTTSLLADTKEISHFVLEDLVLTIEQDGLKTNLVPIIQHVLALRADGAAAEPPEEGEAADGQSAPAESGHRIKVGTVELRDISARIKLSGVPGVQPFDQTFTIPNSLREFSEANDGVESPELAGALILKLKDEALEAVAGEVPGEVLSLLEAALNEGVESGLEGVVSRLQSAAKDKLEAGTDALKDAAADVLSGRSSDPTSTLKKELGGIFGGKKDGR